MKKYLLPLVGIALVSIAVLVGMSKNKPSSASPAPEIEKERSEQVDWDHLAMLYQYLGWAEIDVMTLEADIQETREPGKIAVMIEKLQDAKAKVKKMEGDLAPLEKQAMMKDAKATFKFQDQMRAWNSQLMDSWHAYRRGRMSPESAALHAAYLEVMKNCEYDLK